MTTENTDTFEKLDSKVLRIQHLEAYLSNMESNMQSQGDKMYADLSKKKKQNVDVQVAVEELKIQVDKLTKKISNREKGATDLSEKCQELI